MRRIALAGGLAAVALAGAAGVGLTAWSQYRGPAGGAGQVPMSTALDAEGGAGGQPAGTGPVDTSAGTGSSVTGGSAAADGSGGAGGVTGGVTGGDSGSSADGTTTTATTDGTAAGAGTGGDGTGCQAGPWEPRVQGAPVDFEGGDRAGDYLWHGPTGFHLRVTHRGDQRDVFAGFIRSDRPLAMRPVRLEGRDAAWLSADRRTLGFRFFDYGHIDGVDFVTDCATSLTVTGLTVDGRPLPADRVYLGRYRAHPAQVPFTVTRKPTA